MGKSSSKSAKSKGPKSSEECVKSTTDGARSSSSVSQSKSEKPESAEKYLPDSTQTSQAADVSSTPRGQQDRTSGPGAQQNADRQSGGKVDFETVIIDNGTFSCKSGFAGEAFPRYDVRTVVGRPRKGPSGSKEDANLEDLYIGMANYEKRGVLDINFPIQRGIVTNWDDMEEIWRHIFYRQLKVAPEYHPVVLTDPALNPKENREKMFEIMFEKFHVPSLFVMMQARGAIFTTGRHTGIIVDIGHGVTDIVPVDELDTVDQGIRRIELAGCDITQYLMDDNKDRTSKMDGLEYSEIGHGMKTSLCGVPADFDEVKELEREGKDVRHLYAAEALFQPSILGCNQPSIPASVIESLKACDSFAKDIASNVVLAGGTTLLRGFQYRMQKELSQLAPPDLPVKINETQCPRDCRVWTGTSLFATLPNFKSSFISRERYLDVGPEVANCLD